MSLLLALPKGRLLNEVKVLLEKVGIEFDDKSRKLIINTSKDFIKVAILRTWDIPKFVNYGAADIGVVGKDILFESNLENNYYELEDLGIGQCRMSLASLENKIPRQKKIRVASKYPEYTKKYFLENSKDIEILILKGAIEIAPVLGLADCIVDLVQTGQTLKENGLKELEKISDITSRLIVNKSSFKSKFKEINEISRELKKHI
ncbi:ATP phosphoribosyltransferase [SAR86 cluster bacterium]|jgi:ATP phosphoribosyltransferase|nr:ATP phosphoribosyltransferase [SAR86 cluster bacterium]